MLPKSLLLALALTPTTALAQIPDGWYVYGLFGPNRGPVGIYRSHPRTPGTPVEIHNVQGDLAITGASCIALREADGAVIVGERAPVGASVDLHMVFLNGDDVLLDASFSVGRGGPCCGEIPQCAVLADGRVVVAATDLDAGPLKQWLTSLYGWQGVGIVDTQSGLVAPIDITNGAQILDVFNGLAVSADESTVYLGTYVSSVQGDIWAVPIGGGVATLVASVPAGLSNLACDADDTLWVTTLDSTQGLFRVDVASGSVTQVAQTNGALNAVTYEASTGHFAVASANSGNPSRSIFWMERSGADHLLANPGLATPSGIAIQPTLTRFGVGHSGTATYDWALPNPAGLPLVGDANFSLTVEADGLALPGWVVISQGLSATAQRMFGADIYLDPNSVLFAEMLPFPPPLVMPLPLPNDPALVGLELAAQSIHIQGSTIATTPALRFTLL